MCKQLRFDQSVQKMSGGNLGLDMLRGADEALRLKTAPFRSA